ncbi:MAG: HAD family phosphatase [Clostridia bacterium]|jgi:Cof subfamily protein (haloacid dehalogenase superfamily)|nr:HAD family phosphatase [Clostridia bacterium]
MYKLVAIDLDGTLLNSYGEITEETKKVIKQVQEKGIKVIIASGRPIDSIKTIAKEIESNEYFVSGNGAIVYDVSKEEIIYENILKKSKVLDIIKTCEENSIYYNIYTEKEIIAKSLNFNVLYYHKENLNKDEKSKTHINIVENIYDYIEARDEKIIKITISDNTQSIFNSIMKRLKEIEEIEILDVSHMSRKTIRQGTEEILVEYFYTEISAKNVDKWSALEKLAEQLGIKKEEIIAIGDNVNDKTMIENAGMGVVMEGSTNSVLEIADYVTTSNNEEGVANALKKLILE